MDREQISAVVKWIEANPRLAKSVKDVARQFGVGPDALRRQFRRSQGVSLSVFLNQAKVSQMANLARETSLSFKEIVVEVGFGSRQSASRLFKRQLGMTFSEFRNKARLEGSTPRIRTRSDDP